MALTAFQKEFIANNAHNLRINELAEILGTSPKQVRQHCFHNNITYLPYIAKRDSNTLDANELVIIKGVAEGLTDEEIVSMTGICYNTVRNYLSYIPDKLGLGESPRQVKRLRIALWYWRNNK